MLVSGNVARSTTSSTLPSPSPSPSPSLTPYHPRAFAPPLLTGSLSEAEALDLLAATAGIDLLSLEEDQVVRGLAAEVVNMCGRLALTVAIAGGMVLEYGGEIDKAFVNVMREEGMGEQDDDGEDGSSMTVEDRVIRLSHAFPTRPPTHPPIHPSAHPPTHSPAHPPTRPLTHSPTHPPTHLPTYPPTQVEPRHDRQTKQEQRNDPNALQSLRSLP